jgi:hypothetical protein
MDAYLIYCGEEVNTAKRTEALKTNKLAAYIAQQHKLINKYI